MILIIIGLLIIIYSFFDFKKAYYAFIAYSIFWAPQALCFSFGSRDVIINMVTSFGLLISFIFSYKKLNVTKKIMPFTISFVLIVISMFLTCFFAKAGFCSELTRFVSKVLQTYTTIYISWYIFETKEDFIKLIKIIIIIFFIASIYGLIEFIVQKNIYVDYKRAISTDMLSSYNMTTRGYRIVSVFDHPIGAGLNFALICSFIFYLYVYESGNLPFQKISLVTAALCFINVFLTKARADYLFLLILLLPCLNLKKIKLKKIVITMIVMTLVTLPFFYNRLNIVFSIFDERAQKQIKGSTIEMRMEQYEAIKEEIADSQLFGLGEKVFDYITPEMKDRIKAAEGVWLEQMLKHGVVGILTYLIFAITSIIIIPYKYKSIELLFLGLAFWITYSFTTFLSFRFDIYYCVVFYYIKTSSKYINNSKQLENI